MTQPDYDFFDWGDDFVRPVLEFFDLGLSNEQILERINSYKRAGWDIESIADRDPLLGHSFFFVQTPLSANDDAPSVQENDGPVPVRREYTVADLVDRLRQPLVVGSPDAIELRAVADIFNYLYNLGGERRGRGYVTPPALPPSSVRLPPFSPRA